MSVRDSLLRSVYVMHDSYSLLKQIYCTLPIVCLKINKRDYKRVSYILLPSERAGASSYKTLVTATTKCLLIFNTTTWKAATETATALVFCACTDV